MCNLNLLFSTKPSPEVVVGFMQSVSSISYSSNKDGDGLYLNGGVLVKSTNKLNYLNYADQFAKSTVVISHQRIATSGFEDKYLQPFNDEQFVLAHNGIVPLDKDGHSDTYVLFQQFLTNFKGLPEEFDREKRVRMAIKSVINGMKSSGSYSIVIYDKVSKLSYYFKNMYRSIYGYKTENHLYLTTNNYNSLFLNLLHEPYSIVEVDSHCLYRIDGITMTKIDDIGVVKVKKQKQQSLARWAGSSFSKSVPFKDFNIGKVYSPCSICNVFTNLTDIDGVFYCRPCIREITENSEVYNAPYTI